MERIYEMLLELQQQHLEVIKYPSQQGGYVRAAISSNPDWYRDLCARHMRPRIRYPKPRTIIKRQHTMAALHRMLSGDTTTLYAQRIAEVTCTS